MASDSTCWRLLDRLDDRALAAVAAARARARELVWAQRAETRGRAVGPASVAGHEVNVLITDLDATIVIVHSEKELAAPTFKKTFGYHPMMAFCENTGEFLAGQLRRGNAGANTAADHISVLDAALAQTRTSIATAGRSWSAPTAQDAPRPSLLTSAACALGP